MDDEYSSSKKIQENVVQSENVNIAENTVIAESTIVDENEVQQENVSTPVKKERSRIEKKQHALSMMSGSLAAIIGAATVGITQMLNVSMNAEFVDVTYSDGVISYKINVNDLTDKEELHLYYYDDSEELKQTIDITENGEVSGSIDIDADSLRERLASGDNVEVRYRLSLSGIVGLNVERKFDSYVVSVNKCLSKFEQLRGECHCGVDGTYWFWIDFEDDNKAFSDWSAYIIDSSGTRRDITLTEDLHEAQKVYVLDLATSGTLYVDYKADGVPQPTATLAVNF